MIRALSRALMQLAVCCLGQSRREWAHAMRAEFEAVQGIGSQLTFAAGCLVAAWRELPRHAEGRFGLATHMLSLGLLIPVAYLQFAYAAGLVMGTGGSYGALVATGSYESLAAGAQLSGIPALLFLWTLLGVWHLHLAWVLLERDWDAVVKAGAMIAAAMLTIFTFMALLMLDATTLLVQAGVMAIELIAIFAVARWDARRKAMSA